MDAIGGHEAMNNVKTVFFLGLRTGLLMFFGGLLGGKGGMMMALLFATAMNFGAYWFSDKIILRLYGCQEVDAHTAPELVAMVTRLSERANLPMPKVYLMENPVPNAFATGRNPQHAAVAATTGLLNMLDHDEIEGVMAHELSHVRHRDTLISAIAATVAGAIMMIAHMARWGAIFGGRGDDEGGNPLVMLLTALIAPFAAMLIQMAISRSREFMADRGAADLTGNPQALARALMKISGVKINPGEYGFSPQTAHLMISNPFRGEGLMNLFSTHPTTEARVKALMEQ